MRIPILVAGLSLLLGNMAGAAVHAQSPRQAAAPTATPATASPAPSATPIPAGSTLLRRMRAVLTQRKSFRVESTSTSTWKGHWVQGVTWMDMDIAANTMREVETMQRLRTDAPAVTISVWRRQLLVAHGAAASRTPKTAWYCESLHGVAVRTSLIAFQVRSSHVTNLGATHLAGVAAWHVRATSATVNLWSATAATVDLYVSVADYTPVRIDFHTARKLGGHFERDTIAESYSRFGEAVRVTLPAACRA